VSKPQARFGRRLEQRQVGFLALGQLAPADRSVTEPQDEKLEERPVRRIRVDDENSRHGANFGSGRGNGE
jgi:hypothetical protein